jgi:hypothetical protein
MTGHRVDVRSRSAAAPAAVYALLVDGSTWPAWGPFDSFSLVHDGDAGGESLNAVREFRSRRWGRRTVTRERIVELVPDRRFGYVLLAGLPLRGYRATIDLEPDGAAGCAIHWYSDFEVRTPGTGWLYRRVLTVVIQQCADGVGLQAESAAARPRIE